MKSETRYQAYLINKITDLFPNCYILVNDPTRIQGIPDLLILFESMWAALEVKAHSAAPIQPNQEYYISMFNNMSFASFICPENEEFVLDALQSAFGVSG